MVEHDHDLVGFGVHVDHQAQKQHRTLPMFDDPQRIQQSSIGVTPERFATTHRVFWKAPHETDSFRSIKTLKEQTEEPGRQTVAVLPAFDFAENDRHRLDQTLE